MRRSAFKTFEKPRGFIGSSTEALRHAEALQTVLDEWSFPQIWKHGIFRPSHTTIEALEDSLDLFDFAVFLLTPDDTRMMRGKAGCVPRDNLIFEVGLSFGVIGRHHTFLIHPKGQRPELPTDLLGITLLTFDATSPSLPAAFVPAAGQIRDIVSQRKPKRLSEVGTKSLLFQEDIKCVLKYFHNVAFVPPIIRRHWAANFQYDVSSVSRGVIYEYLTLSYICVNISPNPLLYEAILFSEGDTARSSSIQVAKENELGSKQVLFKHSFRSDAPRPTQQKKTLLLEPSVQYHIRSELSYAHSVSRKVFNVHNAIASRHPVLSAEFTAIVPKGYSFHLSTVRPLKPQKTKERWDFRIPFPILPHQMVEYALTRD